MHTDQWGPVALARRSLAAYETLKNLDGGAPSPQQREVLRGWTGWGPLANAVDPYKRHRLTGAWKEIGEAVTDLLSPQEEQAAKEATATAFYTTPPLAAAVWSVLTGLGFAGGRVLEPGCGSGEFIEAAPPNLDIDWTGVEIDPTSAAVARLLHPHATIINKPLEKTAFRVNAFDAAVGNVPFSKYGPYDPTFPAEEAGGNPSLHAYFLWRAVKALRPGGVAVLITSRYTMDAENGAMRAFLTRSAEFVGAIRLPSGAFAAYGFKGLADIVVLRKRTGDEPEGAGAWPRASKNDYLKTSINDYWFLRPEMLLGRLEPKAGIREGHTLDVVAGDDWPARLEAAVDALVQEAAERGAVWLPAANEVAEVEIEAAGEKEASFHLHADGGVTQVLDGQHVKVAKPSAELKHLILLRDAARDLFEADADLDRPDEEIEPLRQHARHLYDKYVAAYGPLNRSTIVQGPPDEETGFPTYRRRTPAMGGFKGSDSKPGDPDYATVLALGCWDDDTGTEEPAEILRRRVNRRPQRKTSADNPAEAIALCVDEHGRFDTPTVARLLGVEEDQVPAVVAGLAFEDPDEGRWVTADEYLSGNVRVKLARASELAEQDRDRWGGNVVALSQVQPVDLGPSDITARLGAPWIPADDIRDWIIHTFTLSDYEAEKVVLRHEPVTASWEVTAPAARHRTYATTLLGTDRFNAIDLIQHALNNSAPIAYDEIEVIEGGKKKTKRVRNHAATQLAEERIKALQERFGQWLWSDPKRTDRLCRAYNWTYNAVVLRKFDGSMFTFPGLAAGFEPYKHQRAMVARMVADPSALCAHSVGAGKTSVMIMAAMTMKRLGLVNKPCVAVPNHLLEQVAAEFRRRYPGARILMVTKADLTPKRRKYFVAKVAAADWDMIVMTHQQFTSIPVSPQIEADFLADQIKELEEAIASGGEEMEESRTVKRLAKQVQKLRARHDELLDYGRVHTAEEEEAAKAVRTRRDDGLFWDVLGIDYLMVDEFHYFKNLYAATRMEGFSMPSSKRAFDAFMKISWLRARNEGGRCFTGFTGTPISNTLAEAYTLMRYGQSRAWLLKRGLGSFDAFAGLHIIYESKIEVSPDGSGFRMHRRPSKFTNVPELRLALGEFADVRTRYQLKLAGPGRVVRETVKVEAQPEMAPFVKTLVRRADAIRNGKVKPHEDNMLSVCNDGRKAALWLPLVDIDGSGPCKLDRVAEQVARIYHDYKSHLWPDTDSGMLFGSSAPGALQLVFCDLGTPGDFGDQAYGEMRRLMVAAGIPKHQIRYIHDASTDLERAMLFQACRNGDVAVLIASTEKAGTGTNIQDRLVAIHHVDAPWRPADIEQRDGRGDRPGNLSEVLYIYRYVTEGSFDAYMWQGLERKSWFIFQVLSGELSARQVDDLVSEDTLDYAHIKAVSTGQELVLELAKAQAEAARLLNLHTAFKRDQARLSSDQRMYSDMAWRAADQGRALRRIAEAAQGAPRHLVTYSATVTNEEEAAERLAEAGRLARQYRQERDAGAWRGVKVKFAVTWIGGKALLSVKLSARHDHRWWSVEGAKPDLLRPGSEKRLLKLIDKAIDAADAEADEQDYRAEVLRQQAEMIQPELDRKFEHEATLKAALRERKRLEDLVAEELNPKVAESQPALAAAA